MCFTENIVSDFMTKSRGVLETLVTLCVGTEAERCSCILPLGVDVQNCRVQILCELESEHYLSLLCLL